MYLLDSNIIIGFLNGDKKIGDWMNKEKSNSSLFAFAISTIGRIEVLSDKKITERQAIELEKFLDTFDSLPISDEIARLAAMLRREKVLTLGDAIIAATAIIRKRTLVTRDKSFAKKVSNLVEILSI
ncbi:MAG: PIN domain-containing protein [Candidatus Parcubacteria bacterium]|nr:PIN domain-containing protein [Candidatus Parcubacteria bacterium]